jgi:hypothetical protein
MRGSSTEKTVALFSSRACKHMLSLTGKRFDDIITIQKQQQTTLAKFKTQDFNSRCILSQGTA